VILGAYFMDFLSELRELLESELKHNSIDLQTAEKISDTITIKIRKTYSGQPFYIQKKTRDNSIRNAEIYRRFNGRNLRQICREYDLCYQQVCKIIKIERKERQRDLFA
jgi:Mor family transcriptional regulator